MRTVKILVAVTVVLLLLTGCGGNRTNVVTVSKPTSKAASKSENGTPSKNAVVVQKIVLNGHKVRKTMWQYSKDENGNLTAKVRGVTNTLQYWNGNVDRTFVQFEDGDTAIIWGIFNIPPGRLVELQGDFKKDERNFTNTSVRIWPL